MRFTAEHLFPGPPEAIATILDDPDFYRDLELPDLQLLEVRSIDTPGTSAAPPDASAPHEHGLVLRYEFTGNLDALALRLLGGERLTWSQEVRLWGNSGGRLTFAAEANPGLLHGRADFVFEPQGERTAQTIPPEKDAAGVETLRRLQGELTVALPVVGGMAERGIVPGVLARLDAEADAVRRWLARSQSSGGASQKPG